MADLMITILILCAFAYVAIGVYIAEFKSGIIEGVSIFIAVLIVILVSAGVRYYKEKKFRELKMELTDTQRIRVIGEEESGEKWVQ